MQKNKIILSQGVIPFLGIKKASNYALKIGFDGLEILPTRIVCKEIKSYSKKKLFPHFFKNVKSIHQSWRLDMGRDTEYGIGISHSILFIILRILFFTKKDESSRCVEWLVDTYKLPVITHDTSPDWIQNSSGKEFAHGIQYEIIGEKRSREEIKKWLKIRNHSIVVDTRDDQSLSWGTSHGFKNWKDLWQWIGINKIRAVQLTFIGTNTMQNILGHQTSLAEDQLLWLHSQKWKGTVTVEVNPLSLLYVSRGKFNLGLRNILLFVKQTLIKGGKWSQET